MGEDEEHGRIRGRAVGCPSLVREWHDSDCAVALAESHTTTKGSVRQRRCRCRCRRGRKRVLEIAVASKRWGGVVGVFWWWE